MSSGWMSWAEEVLMRNNRIESDNVLIRLFIMELRDYPLIILPNFIPNFKENIWRRDTGCWVLDAGYLILDAG